MLLRNTDVKWTCKIVDFPRNFKIEMVATCSTTDGMAVATDPRHHFSKRWHGAAVKNIAGEDQVTLIADRNFAIYVCFKIATNASWLMAASSGRWNSTYLTSKTSPVSARWWPGSIKIRNYENVCLRDQAKTLKKNIFFAVRPPPLWWHCTLFFPTITRNGLCSHLRKIISWRPWPPPKNRDIHIQKFFFRF